MIRTHKQILRCWSIGLHDRRRRKMEKILVSGKGHFSRRHWRHITQCPECRAAYDQWSEINAQISLEESTGRWGRLPQPLAGHATARLPVLVLIPVIVTALFAFWFAVSQEQAGLRSAVRVRGSTNGDAIAAGSMPGIRYFVGARPDALHEVLPDDHGTILLPANAWLQMAYANPTTYSWDLDLTIVSHNTVVLTRNVRLSPVKQAAIDHALSVEELPREGVVELRLYPRRASTHPAGAVIRQSVHVLRTPYMVEEIPDR